MAEINRLTSPLTDETDDARLNRLLGALSQTNMLPSGSAGDSPGAPFRGYRPSTNVQLLNGMDAPTANMARLSMYDALQRGKEQNLANARWAMFGGDEGDNDPDSPPFVPPVNHAALAAHLRNTEPYNQIVGDGSGMGWTGGTPSIMLGASSSPGQQGAGGYSPQTNPADAALAGSITQALQGPDADEIVRRVRAFMQSSR